MLMRLILLGTGKGSSKKKAKHHAAEDLLRNMYNLKGQEGGESCLQTRVDQGERACLEKSLPDGGGGSVSLDDHSE